MTTLLHAREPVWGGGLPQPVRTALSTTVPLIFVVNCGDQQRSSGPQGKLAEQPVVTIAMSAPTVQATPAGPPTPSTGASFPFPAMMMLN